MFERRRVQRTKIFKAAKLTLAGCLTVDGIARDLSNHGACLQLASTVGLPDEFDLTFDTGCTLRRCHIVWQSPNNVGVLFEQSKAI
jgi:predicted small secreted protein